MMGAKWMAIPVAAVLLNGAMAGAQAATGQEGQPTRGTGEGRRGQYAGMGRAAGEITAISGAMLTIKGDDSATQIVTTDNTRVMKERGPVKVSDLHVGDGVMAMGNLDAPHHTLHAAVVMAEDAAQVKALRENLGKTYISGRVTAVDLDNAKMTVERPDHVAQTIGFDETTSFKRALRPQRTGEGGSGATAEGSGGGRMGGGLGMMGAGAGLDQAFTNGESITLADIKIGDRVAGTGSLKGGTFVPAHLLDGPPGQRRARGEAGAPGAALPAGPGPGSR